MTSSDDGVSQVIGVILMVAATVILAGIIAGFVFGLVGNVDKTTPIGIASERLNKTHIRLTNQGGQDQPKLVPDHPFTVRLNGVIVDSEIPEENLRNMTGSQAIYDISEETRGIDRDDLLVAGNFNSGKTEVVYSGTI
ncbi:MAG: type IV pilin N-terminal domain-containing protein [Methanospirillum sp.]|uniref:type IV pilin N-terminal domain-containing protein n=1 Tax=Methanospirillum sp. TaxID=45200 RepID=UPI00236CAC05|nr:type IV pilin N-terminal domain-containing protein [Methanospirillum sp.]MDD1730444.1 type IV pilin N-terminal domain-containing protein [Methanospirillum sp.]